MLQLLIGVAAVGAMVAAFLLTRRALRDSEQRVESAQQSLSVAERRIEDLAHKEKELLAARGSLRAAERRIEELASVQREAKQLQASLEQSREEGTQLQTAVEESRREQGRLNDLLNGVVARYRPVIDVEKRAHELQTLHDAQKAALEGELSEARARAASEVLDLRNAADEAAKLRQEAETLRAQCATAHQRYETLTAEVLGLEESLENISVGLYRPHFANDDHDSYKTAIENVRDDQQSLVKAGRAAACQTSGMAGNGAHDDPWLAKKYLRLMLRAFNAEANAAIASVTWTNVTVMTKRIERAFEELNTLGAVMQISITDEYKASRIRELQLVYDAAEFRKREREEARRARVAQREEERVQRELAKERDDAGKEEMKHERALAKVRLEMDGKRGAERETMLARIGRLEADLADAHERKERAITQAQRTNMGHVYVVSNVGAFGEDIIKIGLTRRLEPAERIKELGDGSVPFPFDVHALLYSEDAPALEARLHNRFRDRRVNLSNGRQEFFRVSLDEIHDALAEFGLSSRLHRVSEAREYRETLALLQALRTEAVVAPASGSNGRQPRDPFEGRMAEQAVMSSEPRSDSSHPA